MNSDQMRGNSATNDLSELGCSHPSSGAKGVATASAATSPSENAGAGSSQDQRKSLNDQARQMRDQTSQTAGETQKKAKEAVASLRQSAGAAADETMRAAGEATEQLRQQGVAAVTQQKERAAEELSHFGAAIRRAADTLHEENDETVASYADMVADRVDQASHYLREADMGQLIDDVESFARRRPEIVFGGLFIAGLAMSRFLKASRPQADYRESRAGRFSASDGAGQTSRDRMASRQFTY